jgi:hypothetical protein
VRKPPFIIENFQYGRKNPAAALTLERTASLFSDDHARPEIRLATKLTNAPQ